MSKQYKLSELIIDNEEPHFIDEEKLKSDTEKKIKEIKEGKRVVRHLTWIDQTKDIKSVKTPDGKELTPEELFDFVIGNNITDLTQKERTNENMADIAIVLGNIELRTTKERALKAFELYKLGYVKRIIFTGGISKQRDKKGFMHPESKKVYMSNEVVQGLEWEDLTEADWGAETFLTEEFDENYKKHSLKTEKFLREVGINPEDILIEDNSTTTQENAEFCKNIFEMEEIELGNKINSAIIVTTCTHGNRATRQFKKVFGDKIRLKWCPSTLDLEQHKSLKDILSTPNFSEIDFRYELKKLYCTNPQLTQMLREEIGHHRNVFIRGEIEEPEITTLEEEMQR